MYAVRCYTVRGGFNVFVYVLTDGRVPYAVVRDVAALAWQPAACVAKLVKYACTPAHEDCGAGLIVHH
jgi:hypothetical protein